MRKKLFISVAFITDSGIAPLMLTLEELEDRKVPGQILTTDYLMFSEPKAPDRLSKLKNLKVKVFKTTGNGDMRIVGSKPYKLMT